MGSGKSAVLGEASDILADHNIEHAAIDVDALGLAHLSFGASDAVMWDNLRSLCRNYSELGVQNFLLARALETATELRLCKEILPAKNIEVCRLTASMAVMQRRVELREPGISGGTYVARVAILNSLLENAHLENFTVKNEDRGLTEVAMEVLMKAGWLGD
jgi:hypothetical protein